MPELKIFTGPMYGGKTTRLLSALERYVYQNKKVALFKPSVDERYSTEMVVTHSGVKWEAYRVPDGESILNTIPADCDIVAVDEMFMIEGSAEALIYLYKTCGKTILISSLQLSYEGEAFKEMQAIMPFATSIEVCPAVCSKPYCNEDAYFTARISGGTDLIEVGGIESYEPRCHNHRFN